MRVSEVQLICCRLLRLEPCAWTESYINLYISCNLELHVRNCSLEIRNICKISFAFYFLQLGYGLSSHNAE